MNDALWQGLLANLAAVAILTMLWTHLMQFMRRWTDWQKSLALGAFMALGALIVMQVPFQTSTGARLDHRFTFIGVAALFGGPIAVIITTAVTSAYRIYLGGATAFTGLVGIATTTIVGLAWHFVTVRRARCSFVGLLLFSASIPTGVISSLFLLPPML